MNEQELLKKGRILALKVFAESFLVKEGNTKTEELFEDRDINEKTKLSGGEVYVLHHWLMDEYNAMGLDLKKIIEEKGEVTEENKLTNYEINELIRRADIMLLQLSVFKKYLENNKE